MPSKVCEFVNAKIEMNKIFVKVSSDHIFQIMRQGGNKAMVENFPVDHFPPDLRWLILCIVHTILCYIGKHCTWNCGIAPFFLVQHWKKTPDHLKYINASNLHVQDTAHRRGVEINLGTFIKKEVFVFAGKHCCAASLTAFGAFEHFGQQAVLPVVLHSAVPSPLKFSTWGLENLEPTNHRPPKQSVPSRRNWWEGYRSVVPSRLKFSTGALKTLSRQTTVHRNNLSRHVGTGGKA